MSALVPRQAREGRSDGRRRTWRRIVDIVLAAACLAAVVIGGRALAACYANSRGDAQLAQRDFAGAEKWYSRNLVANWFQPWIAPYNTGVALYYENNWSAAEARFAQALPLAPDDKRCTVALNLAWSLEAEGDSLQSRGQPDAAVQKWEDAKQAAQAAHCEQAGSSSSSTQKMPKQKSEAPDRNQGSPQQQQQQTAQRNEQKAEDAKGKSQPDKDGSEEAKNRPDPHQQLDQDNTEAAAGQGRREDESSGKAGKGGTGDPTW